MATELVAFRLEGSLVRRLEEEARRMSEGRLGPPMTRVDALRVILNGYFALQDVAGTPREPHQR